MSVDNIKLTSMREACIWAAEHYSNKWEILPDKLIVRHRTRIGRSPFSRNCPLFKYYMEVNPGIYTESELISRAVNNETYYNELRAHVGYWMRKKRGSLTSEDIFNEILARTNADTTVSETSLSDMSLDLENTCKEILARIDAGNTFFPMPVEICYQDLEWAKNEAAVYAATYDQQDELIHIFVHDCMEPRVPKPRRDVMYNLDTSEYALEVQPGFAYVAYGAVTKFLVPLWYLEEFDDEGTWEKMPSKGKRKYYIFKPAWWDSPFWAATAILLAKMYGVGLFSQYEVMGLQNMLYSQPDYTIILEELTTMLSRHHAESVFNSVRHIFDRGGATPDIELANAEHHLDEIDSARWNSIKDRIVWLGDMLLAQDEARLAPRPILEDGSIDGTPIIRRARGIRCPEKRTKKSIWKYLRDSEFRPEWDYTSNRLIIHATEPGRSPYAKGAPLYEYFMNGPGQNRGYTEEQMNKRQEEQENLYMDLLDGLKEYSNQFGALQKLHDMCYELLDLIRGNGHLSIEKQNEMLRDLRWVHRSLRKWIFTNMSEGGRPNKRFRHVDLSALHDVIIDGVPWNPVMFRRFLPKQLISKVHAVPYHGYTIDYVPIMNTTLTKMIRDDRITSGWVHEMLLDEMQRLRDKGYKDEAALYDSMPDYYHARMALIYYERSIVLSRVLHGEDVTGELNRINTTIREANYGQLNAAFTKLRDVASDTPYDQLPSVI